MTQKQIIPKKVAMTLVGVNGNAWALLGTFSRFAADQDWTPEEIELVLKEAMRSDYDHLVATLCNHTTNEPNHDQLLAGWADEEETEEGDGE